jgi:hypothetical protein
MNTRSEIIAGLLAEDLDLLIIGGGIVGAGVARDAAMRGLRVGLVEQFDFAFGTSSRSSRLLHGGLRYLAQGRLGLVSEASREKRILHHIAPHLAAPLAFIFPTYRHSNWPLWQLAIGVKIYDLLCGGKNLGKSSWLNKAEVLKWVPVMRESELKGAVRYYDALTNDARLVLVRPDRYVAAFAAWSLGNLGDAAESAVADLGHVLGREDTNDVVTRALARIGPAATAAVPDLVRELRSETEAHRWRAARALGRIGPGAEPAVAALTAALADRSGAVRMHSARALGRIGPAAKPAAAALQRTTGDRDGDVSAAAREALERLAGRPD